MFSGGAAKAQCKDPTSCQAHMQTLIERLDTQRQNMSGKHSVLDALEGLRKGIISGERVELPTTHRQHLSKGTPLVQDISIDSKHRPLSTNLTRHLRHMRTIADDVDVKMHQILPLK